MKTVHFVLSAVLVLFCFVFQAQAARPVIMLTGFWPPTNEMLRPWSNNPNQNPNGWQGSDWENLGYDVFAFFPEYPNWNQGDHVGEGDFTVDYMDTYGDFIRYAQILKPIAVVSFGLNPNGGSAWLIETDFPNYWQQFWPASSPVSYSTLPTAEIQKAVNLALGKKHAGINLGGDAGNYLCGYLGRLETRYQEKHSNPTDPYYMKAAGFIHVTTTLTSQELDTAMKATLRALIQSL